MADGDGEARNHARTLEIAACACDNGGMRVTSSNSCASGSQGARPSKITGRAPKRPAEGGPSAAGGGVTGLLQSWAAGDHGAQERLFERVYPELRRLAAAKLYREPYPASIQATDLVGEAYLRLVDQSRVDWQCRAQFFAISATLIRRILVDRAKRRVRLKRGAGAVRVSLDRVDPSVPGQDVDLLALDQALVDLARIRASSARIVELRYFGGLSIDETADTLGLGPATVVRQWRFAKAWLAERLRRRA